MSGTDFATNPPWWARMVVGILGTAIVIAPPFAARFSTTNLEEPNEITAFIIGTGVVYGLAGLLSVFLTTIMKEDNILKCLFTSLGIPGIAVSLSVGAQLIQ